MNNVGKIVVATQTDGYFLKEGVILQDSTDRNPTSIKFGINDIQNWGTHGFVLKENLVDEFDGLKAGDIRYFIWDETVYEVKIMFLIKPNETRFQHDDEWRFIGKCSPEFFRSNYISDEPMCKLIRTKKEAEKKNISNQIERLATERDSINIRLYELNNLYSKIYDKTHEKNND